MKKKSKGKIIIIAIVAFLAVGVVFGLINNMTGNTEKISESKEVKPNTSAKVDDILLKAKDDAEKITEDKITKKWKESFDYLKAHCDNFYESNEIMEKSMYYGEFIYQYIEANANAKNVSQLVDSTKTAYDAGYNTVKAIKYVYRNSATPEDEETVNALTKAQEALSKFK